MVQIISSSQFNMQSFAFQRGIVFDHHAIRNQSFTLTEANTPNLVGSYTASSLLTQWDGATLASAARIVAYAGQSISANDWGTPNGGTVTGVFKETGDLHSNLIGVSISAADIFAASQTTSRLDDTNILRAELAGDDRATLSAFADIIAMQTGRDVVYAGAGNDTVMGNSGGDSLFGDAGDDYLSGGYGYDRLAGGLGHDLIHGGAGGDRMFGNQGSDTLYGDVGNDLLEGGYGFDRLMGGTGADTITGGAGRDLMFGGPDNVRDSFVFNSVDDSPTLATRDVIYHFARGVDVVDLRGIDANDAVSGDQAFAFSSTGARAHSLWVSAVEGAVIVRADVTGDRSADFEIRIDNLSGLSATDFLL